MKKDKSKDEMRDIIDHTEMAYLFSEKSSKKQKKKK